MPDDLDALLHEIDRAPRWKRALWRIRSWLWPVRWDRHFRAVEVCLPVDHVAGAMLGSRRWIWLRSPRRRVPVGFRLQVGPLVTWRRKETDDE